MNEKDRRWRIIIADAIIRVIGVYKRGEFRAIDFVGDVAEQDEELNDPRNVTEISLSAAWNYADSFCDAAKAGFDDLDGITWEEAVRLLEEVAKQLQDEQPIINERALRYAWR